MPAQAGTFVKKQMKTRKEELVKILREVIADANRRGALNDQKIEKTIGNILGIVQLLIVEGHVNGVLIEETAHNTAGNPLDI